MIQNMPKKNDTKIKYIQIADKIYLIDYISFATMTIKAVEYDVPAAELPESEIWQLHELDEFKITLRNRQTKPSDVIDFKK